MTIQLEKLVSSLELDNKGFKTALLGAAAGLTALVGIGAAAVKWTMDWAADLDGLGDVMDGTNKDFAALAFVARKSGVGVDAVVKANVLLNKGLLKTNGTLDITGKKLKEYGINVKDANGNVKNSIQLTDEIAQKYKSLSTQQERLNFLTEIYGKSGASMVDFYDTLNSEGGISAVTKKVEALGLAIDPARYEIFNRNLEELKMVGLGVAVAFTEQLMPVLEKFLDWAIEASPQIKKFADGLIKAFQEGGLGGLASFLDTEIAGVIDDVDWAELGKKVGDKIEGMFTNASGEIDVPKTFTSLASALNNFFAGALFGTDEAGLQKIIKDGLAEIQDEFTYFFENQKGAHQTFWDYIVQYWTDKALEMKEGVKTWASDTLATFLTWNANTSNAINTWGMNILNSIGTSLINLKGSIETKLGEINKVFEAKATGWINKAVNAVTAGRERLIEAIESIKDDINALLSKIKSSIRIDVSMPDWVKEILGIDGGGGSTGGGKKDDKKYRHGGGAVMAGQAYTVKQGEQFVPNTSGRIEPMREQRVVVDIDYNKLARAMKQYAAKAA